MDRPVGQTVHVAMNAHLLSSTASYRSAGVHRYIYHLLTSLPEAGCRVTAFLGPTSASPNTSIQLRRSRWPTERPLVRVMWEQLAQPWALHQTKAELVHGPVFVGPLLTARPLVITIHDLSFVRFPHLFRPANRLYLTVLTRASAHKARRVIAVSTHAADETARLLGVRRDKIDIVHHGVDPVFKPLPRDKVESFRARKGLPQRFLLYLGTLEPRKNLVRLVESFSRLRRRDVKLILAGGRGWYDEPVFARVRELGLQDAVLFPGYVPGKELPLWYNAATAFVLPSLYEGFGMPLLEAMASSIPVLASDIEAHREVLGEAALFFDPCDPEGLARRMKELYEDRELRRTLTEKGDARAGRFTWEASAARTARIYRRFARESA